MPIRGPAQVSDNETTCVKDARSSWLKWTRPHKSASGSIRDAASRALNV